jgi:hypothetical protein
MTAAIPSLTDITNALLAHQNDLTLTRNAAGAMKTLFEKVTGFDEIDPQNGDHVLTESGTAVGPFQAAACIIDFMRTRAFLRGMAVAIRERLLTHPHEPVKIFYAGTGPFATLMTPLTTLFSPAEMQWVLLDINPVSIGYLQQMIRAFALSPYIIDVVQADATKYNIPPAHQPDILVSETMKFALHKEPQVDITAHLLSQCRKDVQLIPENIRIEAGCSRLYPDGLYDIRPMQLLFDLNKTTALQLVPLNEWIPPQLMHNTRLILPQDEALAKHDLTLFTTITVFKEHGLAFNESGLTTAFRLQRLVDLPQFPREVHFTYRRGAMPGFHFTLTY